MDAQYLAVANIPDPRVVGIWLNLLLDITSRGNGKGFDFFFVFYL